MGTSYLSHSQSRMSWNIAKVRTGYASPTRSTFSLASIADVDHVKELRRCYNRSALLDALHHLSDNGPHNHTVVAWTGEIRQAADNNDDAVSDDNLPITPSSTSISLGGNARMQIAPSKNVFVTRADQLRLEQQLHEDDISIVPVWLCRRKRHDDGRHTIA